MCACPSCTGAWIVPVHLAVQVVRRTAGNRQWTAEYCWCAPGLQASGTDAGHCSWCVVTWHLINMAPQPVAKMQDTTVVCHRGCIGWLVFPCPGMALWRCGSLEEWGLRQHCGTGGMQQCLGTGSKLELPSKRAHAHTYTHTRLLMDTCGSRYAQPTRWAFDQQALTTRPNQSCRKVCEVGEQDCALRHCCGPR
jgi:hypothetical protein